MLAIFIIVLSVFGWFFIVSWIKAISSKVSVHRYCRKHKADLETIDQEVSTLLSKANEIDRLLGNCSTIVTKYVNGATKKYKEYDFVLQREARNNELRRYFANKANRRKSW